MLRLYASEQDGWLPYGKATPEESILATNSLAEYLLCGKNIPHEKTQEALAKNQFGPEVCGWHYVEGLRESDPPQIAVVWDKVVGLNHNGMRHSGWMHEVVNLDGSTTFILKTNWFAFVATQKELLAKVIAGRETNAPPIRWSDEETLGPNRFPAPKN
jgi:hypothetical protein